MNRNIIAAAAIALAALPLVSAARSTPSAMHESMGAPNSMSEMAMPKSSMKHDGMMLGALPTALQGKPVVVRIHADWCPACKATRATYEGVEKRYADKATFVTFDVTDAKTAAAAATEAKKLGLSTVVRRRQNGNVNGGGDKSKTGAVSATLYNDNTPGDYAKAIDAVQSQLQRG